MKRGWHGDHNETERKRGERDWDGACGDENETGMRAI